ncbi:hypothetical protein OHB41_51300 [Streptomyces sp. NBC_01571]|nr:hypothetical protein [Streptomyces sp. NBC_01571]MCX4581346.1 hypothetical protein [Streptomyces sp. NBC_01571]
MSDDAARQQAAAALEAARQQAAADLAAAQAAAARLAETLAQAGGAR